MTPSITFRPIRDDDLEFLYRVYASTRQEEMALTPWDAAEKEIMVRIISLYQGMIPDSGYQIPDDEGMRNPQGVDEALPDSWAGLANPHTSRGPF